MKFVSRYGSEYEVVLVRGNYVYGNGLYVAMKSWNDEYQFWENYCTVTVNLVNEELTDDDCAFVDTNNVPDIVKFLVDNQIAFPTGVMARSGFCEYPEFRFDVSKIMTVEEWQNQH